MKLNKKINIKNKLKQSQKLHKKTSILQKFDNIKKLNNELIGFTKSKQRLINVFSKDGLVLDLGYYKKRGFVLELNRKAKKYKDKIKKLLNKKNLKLRFSNVIDCIYIKVKDKDKIHKLNYNLSFSASLKRTNRIKL